MVLLLEKCCYSRTSHNRSSLKKLQFYGRLKLKSTSWIVHGWNLDQVSASVQEVFVSEIFTVWANITPLVGLVLRYIFLVFWSLFPPFVDNKTALRQKLDSKVDPPISSREVPGHCSPINRLCEDVGYNLTQIPNHFNQQNQNDAEQELSQFTSMIQSNCSSVLHVFLCSLYFPPCTDDCDPPTPPCRSVCRAARRDCEPWLKRSGHTWPYKFKCSAFPDPNESACVGEDGTITSGKNCVLSLPLFCVNNVTVMKYDNHLKHWSLIGKVA